MLSVRNLAKAFGAITVLEDISFVINAGDRVGIVGANGVGKTTLLSILAGQESAMLDFPGPIMAVSHDRWFIQRFGGTLWRLEDGKILQE